MTSPLTCDEAGCTHPVAWIFHEKPCCKQHTFERFLAKAQEGQPQTRNAPVKHYNAHMIGRYKKRTQKTLSL